MSGGSRITKFCHLFFDGDDGYVFFKSLGHGLTFQAQLVLHIPTAELRVRKVSHLPLDREATRIEDCEKVLFFLQEQAAKQGVQPHISYLYSASDVPAVGTKEDCELWSRVSYSKYYNGGTMGGFYRDYVAMAQAIPSTTIWRLMTQIVDALHFMSTCGEGVLHGDVHEENIFLHYEGAEGALPDFFLGDFGNAEYGKLADSTRYGDDVRKLSYWLNRWLSVCPVPEPSERDELWKYLYFIVLPALQNVPAHGRLPDLKLVIELLRNAPAGPPESLPEWMDRRAEDEGLPMFYTYEDECREAEGVNGPWYVAKVSIGIHKRLFTVLDLSAETYTTGSAGPDPVANSPGTPEWAKKEQVLEDLPRVLSADYAAIAERRRKAAAAYHYTHHK